MGPRDFLRQLAAALDLPPETTFCCQLFSNKSSALGADEDGSVATGDNQTFLATAETIGAEVGRRVGVKFPNVYLASGLFPAEAIVNNSGRTQENCTRALWLTIDADAKDWLAHAEEKPVKEVVEGLHELSDDDLAALLKRHGQALVEVADEVGLRPSLWVRSGYGHYGLYLLADGTDIDEARRLSAALRDAWCAAAGWKIADSTIDAGTRIVRLVGTWNVKNPERPRPCKLCRSSWRIYTVAELAERFPVVEPKQATPPPPRRAEARDGAPAEDGQDERLARLSRNALLYLQGHLPPVGQRNPTLFNVACEMEAAGFTRDEAETKLRPWAVSNGLDAGEIRSTVGSAFRKEREPARTVAHLTGSNPLADTNLEFRLLASAMASPDSCAQVCSRCEGWLFSSSVAQQIFFAIRSLDAQRLRVDPMVVYNDLHSRSHEAAAEAARELTADQGLATDQVTEIISILRQHATGRRVLNLCRSYERMLCEPHEHHDLDAFFAEAQAISTFRTPTNWSSLAEVYRDVYTVAESTAMTRQKMEEEGDRQGIASLGGLPLPLPDLNDILGAGLELGYCSIVGGAPARGKTAFAMQLALSLAKDHHIPAGIVSLELQTLKVGQRMLCSELPLLGRDLRRANLCDQEWSGIARLMNEASGVPLHFFDLASTFHEVRSAISVGALEFGLKLVLVDFAQQIQMPQSKRGEVGDMSYIMRGLHDQAKRLGIHICILSQLRKGANIKRPESSDFLGSGSLEQMIRTGISVWNDKDSSHQRREALIRVIKGDEGTGEELACYYDTKRQRFVR